MYIASNKSMLIHRNSSISRTTTMREFRCLVISTSAWHMSWFNKNIKTENYTNYEYQFIIRQSIITAIVSVCDCTLTNGINTLYVFNIIKHCLFESITISMARNWIQQPILNYIPSFITKQRIALRSEYKVTMQTS